MGGAISSLGLGSGVLTSDIIDQLKEADTSRIVTPIESKITLNDQEQEAEKLLTSLMKTFKASASALSYDTIFDNKTVDVNGLAEVTVETGATIESFTLETVTLAKQEITSFGALADASATPVASEAGTLSIAGFDIAYDETMSLEELAQAITETAGSKVSASILNTGTGSYSLVVSSKGTGASQELNITDTSGFLDPALTAVYDAATNPNGYQTVQAAVDAEFKYNGITVTRTTNDISDLVLGVEITLKAEGDFSTVAIEQNTDSITTELQLFSDTYNTLMQNISDMLTKDEDTGAEGIFNGNSFVKGITRDLNTVLTAMNPDNDSLVNYGIEVDKYGTMSFDKSTFENKLAADPDGVKVLFTGGVDANGNDVAGWFENIDDKLNEYTGYGKLLSNFETELTTQGSNLNDSYMKAVESLEARYEIMTKRFIAYDGMISRMNAQFSSLQMMISDGNKDE